MKAPISRPSIAWNLARFFGETAFPGSTPGNPGAKVTRASDELVVSGACRDKLGDPPDAKIRFTKMRRGG
jgi:hypothetical protein